MTDYVYDLRGLVTQVTDGRAIVTNLAYDNAGRLATKTYPAAVAENVTFTYDAIAGGNKGKGRLTSFTDESGSTASVYDARGNIVSETRTVSGQAYPVAYSYDSADRITGMTYPSGRIVSYVRDGQGRITSVTTKKDAAAAVVTLASSLVYQPMSRIVTSFTYGNGLAQADTVTLDYELSQLLMQNGAANVINRTHNRTDLLNLTGIGFLLGAADSRRAKSRDDRSAGRHVREHHELRLHGCDPAVFGHGAVGIAIVDV